MGRYNTLFTPSEPPRVLPNTEQKPLAQPHLQEGRLAEPQERKIKPSGTVIPRYHDTMQPRHHGIARSIQEDEIIETVRKAVKHIGKEAATHRFTLEEKQLLADIEYTYRRQGVRTSENEITRIAINYFAEDFKKNGENSILVKVLKKLNA